MTVAVSVANAKELNLKESKFGSYLLVSKGPSTIHKDAYLDENTTTTEYSGGISSNSSGEFGFLYTTKFLTWRFGFEIMKPDAVSADATDASGSYNVATSITGYMPKVGLEINFITRDWYRLYGFGFAGQASVDVNNTYTANTVAAPGAANFATEYKGNCNALGGGLGIELTAADNATFTIEGAYRDMDITSMTYNAAVTDFLGAHAAGDTVKDKNGKAREINMTGAYLALGLRFWLF